MNQKQKFCRVCDRPTLHATNAAAMGCGTHVFLTLVTLGFWLPIAMLTMGVTSVGNAAAGYRCQTCGGDGSTPRPAKVATATGFSGGRVVFALLAIIAGVFVLAAIAGN
jgi:hypothetical protein